MKSHLLWRRGFKRPFDLILATIGLLLLTPLFFMISFAIFLEGFPIEKTIFYKQIRTGLKGRPFILWKFRTMRSSSISGDPQPKTQLTISTDSRITRVGALLRKYKLDELPQLFNILRGEMSLVGPRPEVPRYVAYYPQEYQRILEIRPGLTDFASLEFSNESELFPLDQDPEEFYRQILLPKKLALNLHYLNTCSFTQDFAIILQTIKKVFL